MTMTGHDYSAPPSRPLSRRQLLAGITACGALTVSTGKPANAAPARTSGPWDLRALRRPPRVFQAEPEFAVPGLTAIYYEGLTYQGRPTRVFAYYGVPAAADGRPVPAVVLAHGGGGTAYAEWVQLWNDRGYAALAMDLEGHVPVRTPADDDWQQHDMPGPDLFGVFGDYREPVADQWMYHAVAQVILGHSLLRSLPGVDRSAVGMAGISWGAVNAGIVAGLDRRLRFVVPVYGCGWLYDLPTNWGAAFDAMGEFRDEVIARYDPSSYVADARMPMLWTTGANDAIFHLSVFSRTYAAARRAHPRTVMSAQQDVQHSHPAGWAIPEVYAFADSIAGAGPALPYLGRTVVRHGIALTSVRRPAEVDHAVLWWTDDSWQSNSSTWQAVEACHTGRGRVLQAEIPAGAAAHYFEVTDQHGRIATTAVEPPATG